MGQSETMPDQTEAVIQEARAECFLSSLPVDLRGAPSRYRPGRDWVRNPYRVHQRILMAFPDGLVHSQEKESSCGRILFRVDPEPGLQRVCVLSTFEPNWDDAFRNAGILLDPSRPCVVKQISLTVKRGQQWRFRLRANAASRKGPLPVDDGTKKRPRFRIAAEDQVPWLQRQGELHGFSLTGVKVISSGMQVSWRKKLEELTEEEAARCNPSDAKGMFRNKLIKHWRVDYQGILQVTCPARYAEALIRGIGPGKAFGFGLLSIAPAS